LRRTKNSAWGSMRKLKKQRPGRRGGGPRKWKEGSQRRKLE